MADEVTEEQPRKRMRLAEPDSDRNGFAASQATSGNGTNEAKDDPMEIVDSDDTQKEIKVGITAYVSPHLPGFSGILKQRYTDFLVNEISLTGQVLHLEDIAQSRQKTEKVGVVSSTTIPAEPADQNPENAESKNVAAGSNQRAAALEPEVVEISSEDTAILVDIFGEDTTLSMKALHASVLKHPDRKRRDFTNVLSQPIEDRELRTTAHRAIRRIFSSRLETTTEATNKISISSAGPINKKGAQKFDRNAGQGRARGKTGWDELGGEFLHFTLYKENKDTMEIMYHLASQLKLHVRNFQFAGTKDRRGVTAQRVSVCRVQTDRMTAISRSMRGAKIGGFKYEKQPLALGQLQGNEFCITLRDCHFPGEEGLELTERVDLGKIVVGKAVESLQAKGFINYYGLQRFGSFANGTDDVGKRLLQGDLEGAVAMILSYSPSALAAAKDESATVSIPFDDRKRALAINTWETTGNLQKTLGIMPRKFNAESGIIRHLSVERGGKRINERDYQGALASIQRGLRLMYVHAYQSLVWNTVAGHRWEKFGDQVVEGDLVIATQDLETNDNEVDESGEVIVQPADDDRAVGDEAFVRARPLSKEEAESGTYSILDIVLPLPGFDVEYPTNEIGDFYKEFMGSEKGGRLDPYNMRRTWKDISLSGGYRKFLARPAKMDSDVKSYGGDLEQLVETDLDRLFKAQNPNSATGTAEMAETGDQTPADKVAVIIKMQLGSSQYATMALREMLKSGGLVSFKADFGRER